MGDILDHIIEIRKCARRARRELKKPDLRKVESELKSIMQLDVEELRIIEKNHGSPKLFKCCMKVLKDAKKAIIDLKSIKWYEHAVDLFFEIEKIEVLEYRILKVKHTSTELIIPIEFRNGVNPNDSLVIKHIRLLKKVPKYLRAIIAQSGGYIVFFNGPLTDNREWAITKGVRPPGGDSHTWDNLRAAYNSHTRGVFLGIRGKYIRMRGVFLGIRGNYVKCGGFGLAENSVFLHELGHSFDFEIGEHLFGMPLSYSPVALRAIKKEQSRHPFLNNPTFEYIANSFDMFYRGKRTMNILKKRHLMIYNFLLFIENRTK